jgi:hypothetical protein
VAGSPALHLRFRPNAHTLLVEARMKQHMIEKEEQAELPGHR